jgi:hypothetical protein
VLSRSRSVLDELDVDELLEAQLSRAPTLARRLLSLPLRCRIGALVAPSGKNGGEAAPLLWLLE